MRSASEFSRCCIRALSPRNSCTISAVRLSAIARSPFSSLLGGSAFSASALSSFITAANSSFFDVLPIPVLCEKIADRFDQTFDVVPPCFDADLQTVIARCFRRDRSDARHLHSFWPGHTECEKIFHRRRTGKCDQISPFLQ